MKVKYDSFFIRREVIGRLSSSSEYTGIKAYFPEDELIKISPLLITFLLKFTDKENVTDVQLTILKELCIYDKEAERYYTYLSDQFFQRRGANNKADIYDVFQKYYDTDLGIDKYAFQMLAEKTSPAKLPLHQQNYFIDTFLSWAWIGHDKKDNAARREFTETYLKAIKKHSTTQTLIDFECTVRKLQPVDVIPLNKHLLSCEAYSPYSSMKVFEKAIQDVFNPFVKPPITPLNLCIAQSIGALAVGLLADQNKKSLCAISVLNVLSCSLQYYVYKKSDNYKHNIGMGPNKTTSALFGCAFLTSLANTAISGYPLSKPALAFNAAALCLVSCIHRYYYDKPDTFSLGI